MCIYDDRNSVIRTKKLMSVMLNLGANGDRGKNLLSEVPYLELPTLICLFTMQLLWGMLMIKSSLLLSTPIVKRFQSKKVPFLAVITSAF